MASRGKGLGSSACSRIAPSGTSSATAGGKLCCSSSRRDVKLRVAIFRLGSYSATGSGTGVSPVEAEFYAALAAQALV